MTIMYIPDIGDCITLIKDWTFDLYYESRNASLIKEHINEFSSITGLSEKQIESLEKTYSHTDKSVKHTLRPGTTLQVDRIYIRKGLSGFSSLSFFIKDGSKKEKRFWAKLNDVNTIQFDKATSIQKKLSWSDLKHSLPDSDIDSVYISQIKKTVSVKGAKFPSLNDCLSSGAKYLVFNYQGIGDIFVYKTTKYNSQQAFNLPFDYNGCFEFDGKKLLVKNNIGSQFYSEYEHELSGSDFVVLEGKYGYDIISPYHVIGFI